MNDIALTLHQVRYTNKAFWRNPASAFFTFAFPLMFLVIFSVLLGNDSTHVEGFVAEIKQSTFYTPAIIAFSVVTACYTNIGISLTFARDQGVLKRTRGTPMPAAGYLVARVIHAVFVAILLTVICAAFGRILYGVRLRDCRLATRFFNLVADTLGGHLTHELNAVRMIGKEGLPALRGR